MWKVEFHCHTHRSPDSLTLPRDLVAAARKAGLDRVIVTDHNTLRGALEAQAYDEELIIVGEEVQTTFGEFLAAFVTEEVPEGLPPEEALARLKAQGAFISVSHPHDAWRSGWTAAQLEWLASEVDAFEVFNARVWFGSWNRKAAAFAAAHHLPGTAGTDAHTAAELGRTFLELPPFSTADELRAAVKQGRVVGKLAPWTVHWHSTVAKRHRRDD